MPRFALEALIFVNEDNLTVHKIASCNVLKCAIKINRIMDQIKIHHRFLSVITGNITTFGSHLENFSESDFSFCDGVSFYLIEF